MYHRTDLRIALTLMFLGGAALLKQLHRWKLSQDLQNTGVVPVHSAPQGLVELQGFAWPCEPTVAPLHQRPAAFCQILVEQKAGKNGWRTIADIQIGNPFYLVDHTGSVLVFTEGAEVDMTSKQVFYSKLDETHRRYLTGVLRSHAPSLELSSSIFQTYRITERVLVAGSPVYLSGNLSSRSTTNSKYPFPGLDHFLQKLMAYERNPMSKLMGVHGQNISDSNNNSREVYSQLALEASGGFQMEVLPMAAGGGMVPAPMARGSEDVTPCFGTVTSCEEHKLFFADSNQQEVLNHLRRWMPLKFLASALLVALGATILAFQLSQH